MSTPKPITTCCLVLPPEIVVHNAYIGRHFRQMKITRKASDVAENLQLYRVAWFFHPRSSCTTTHMYSTNHPPKWVAYEGERSWKLIRIPDS